MFLAVLVLFFEAYTTLLRFHPQQVTNINIRESNPHLSDLFSSNNPSYLFQNMTSSENRQSLNHSAESLQQATALPRLVPVPGDEANQTTTQKIPTSLPFAPGTAIDSNYDPPRRSTADLSSMLDTDPPIVPTQPPRHLKLLKPKAALPKSSLRGNSNEGDKKEVTKMLDESDGALIASDPSLAPLLDFEASALTEAEWDSGDEDSLTELTQLHGRTTKHLHERRNSRKKHNSGTTNKTHPHGPDRDPSPGTASSFRQTFLTGICPPKFNSMATDVLDKEEDSVTSAISNLGPESEVSPPRFTHMAAWGLLFWYPLPKLPISTSLSRDKMERFTESNSKISRNTTENYSPRDCTSCPSVLRQGPPPLTQPERTMSRPGMSRSARA